MASKKGTKPVPIPNHAVVGNSAMQVWLLRRNALAFIVLVSDALLLRNYILVFPFQKRIHTNNAAHVAPDPPVQIN